MLHSVAPEQHLKNSEFNEYTYLITMGRSTKSPVDSTIVLYCICQLLKTGHLLLFVFIRGLILNCISEIYWILKLGTSNTNLLLNSSEVSNILVRKVHFWHNNNNYSEIYFKEL